jgi:hypothetical protein
LSRNLDKNPFNPFQSEINGDAEMRKTAVVFAISVAFLLTFELIMLASAQSTSNTSAPDIEWQKTYGGRAVSVSNLIQTIDGGYVFMDLGWRYNVGFEPSTIYKVDSAGNVQWSKTLGPYNTSEYLGASTIIQTNDGGYEIAGGWTIGVTYQYTPTLVKMDAQGNIQWVANYSSLPNLGVSTSNWIRTSDGGFVYCWTDGRIIKTDSGNNRQWTKQFNYTDDMGAPLGILPLSISSVIETSGGALAILAVGEYHSGIARTSIIYLIKTEAFLPLPPKTTLPAPIRPSSMAPIVKVAIVIIVIIVVAVAGLWVYFKKRKHHTAPQSRILSRKLD